MCCKPRGWLAPRLIEHHARRCLLIMLFSPRSDARAQTHLTNTQNKRNHGTTTTSTTAAIDAERLATNKGGNAVNGGWRGRGGGGDLARVAMVARVGCACVCGDQDEG